ncbi:hypothetical protein CDD83_4062 [Cordyceps sp. RAO-2017]|nr:hypothetical protein CDD83_4062 [Cordyceps sp. RAO-2017]
MAVREDCFLYIGLGEKIQQLQGGAESRWAAAAASKTSPRASRASRQPPIRAGRAAETMGIVMPRCRAVDACQIEAGAGLWPRRAGVTDWAFRDAALGSVTDLRTASTSPGLPRQGGFLIDRRPSHRQQLPCSLPWAEAQRLHHRQTSPLPLFIVLVPSPWTSSLAPSERPLLFIFIVTCLVLSCLPTLFAPPADHKDRVSQQPVVGPPASVRPRPSVQLRFVPIAPARLTCPSHTPLHRER